MPFSDRECYKCGQKGHIAINCTSKGNANDVEQPHEQVSAGPSPSFALGQPQKEGIYHVKPIEPPG